MAVHGCAKVQAWEKERDKEKEVIRKRKGYGEGSRGIRGAQQGTVRRTDRMNVPTSDHANVCPYTVCVYPQYIPQ